MPKAPPVKPHPDAKRWVHKTVAKANDVPEDVVRQIYEVVRTSKQQGISGGHMLDFLERHVGRKLIGAEYGVFRNAKEHWAYNPAGGYSGPKPTGIAKEPDVRASASDPTYEKADRLATLADRAINDATTRLKDAGVWGASGSRVKDRDILRTAADELCVAGDLFEEAGAKVRAGTVRQRAKHARDANLYQLTAYRSHMPKRAASSKQRRHLTKRKPSEAQLDREIAAFLGGKRR